MKLTFFLACIVAICGGCDRQSPYEAYQGKIQPLVDELTRTFVLVNHAETFSGQEFLHQMQEVDFQYAKLQPSLTEDDKKRESMNHLVQAVKFFHNAQAYCERNEGSADDPLPSETLGMAEQLNEGCQELMEAQVAIKDQK